MKVHVLLMSQVHQQEAEISILGVYDEENIDNAYGIVRQKYPEDADNIGIYTFGLNDLSATGEGNR